MQSQESGKLIITLHSYKGGTGKTLLSVNLAATYAATGKKVALLDLDLRAPSLYYIFKSSTKHLTNDSQSEPCRIRKIEAVLEDDSLRSAKLWINDYLSNACKIEDVLEDHSHKCKTGGKMFVGFANPATEAIRESTAVDKKWEMRSLGRLLALRTSLLDVMNFDYVILDTSPGLQYSSINAIVSSDVVLVTTTLDKSNLAGTLRMINEFYSLFQKRIGIIVNKASFEVLSSEAWKETQMKLKENELPILETIPCFCHLLMAEAGHLYPFENITSPFTKKLQEIATKIENFTLTDRAMPHSTS